VQSYSQSAITEYLELLEPFGIMGGCNILIASVTGWLAKCDLSASRERMKQRLNDPNDSVHKLLHAVPPFSNPKRKVRQWEPLSKRSLMASEAGACKRRVSELVESSQPLQRHTYQEPKALTSDQLERIVNEIVVFALALTYEDAFAFLTELSAQWILTFNEIIVRDDAFFKKESKSATDEAINKYLLKTLVLLFPY